MKYKSRPQFD